MALFSLFHNCMTGSPCSLAVITQSIYCVCFQQSKLVSLSGFQIDLINLEAVAHLHSGLNSWHTVSIHFEDRIFPRLDCKKAMSQTTHLSLIIPVFHTVHNPLFHFLFGITNSIPMTGGKIHFSSYYICSLLYIQEAFLRLVGGMRVYGRTGSQLIDCDRWPMTHRDPT